MVSLFFVLEVVDLVVPVALPAIRLVDEGSVVFSVDQGALLPENLLHHR